MYFYRLFTWTALTFGSLTAVAGTMPAEQQNALVKKYCAVCHTDAANNGGLSLEHFDAAKAAPSLAAMLLSKITGGIALAQTREIRTNPSAAALVDRKMKSGAMGAAGLRVPDKATIDALIDALAGESGGAMQWSVSSTTNTTTASILREVPSASNPAEVEAYRLMVSCDATTREGSIQVAWSPIPQSGKLTAVVDANTPVTFEVQGSEKMGNGSGVVTKGLAALALTSLPLPQKALVIRDLFPGDTVIFPFEGLASGARQSLAACWSAQPVKAPDGK